MQAIPTDRQSYYIGYFAGNNTPPLVAENQTPANVLGAFHSLAAGNDSWRTLPWQVMDEGQIEVITEYDEKELEEAQARAEDQEQRRLQLCEATREDASLIAGFIKHFDLVNWWQHTFNSDEKRIVFETEDQGAEPAIVTKIVFFEDEHNVGHQRIRESVEEEDPDSVGLVLGEVQKDDPNVGSAWDYLGDVAALLNRPTTRDLAQRFVEKAETLLPSHLRSDQEVLDLHFFCLQAIETFYPDRDKKPDALANAIRFCEGMIAIAPQAARAFTKDGLDSLPSHKGFEQKAPKMLSSDDLSAAVGDDAPSTEPGALTLTSGDVAYVEQSPTAFLEGLALWLEEENHQGLAQKSRLQANILRQEQVI